MKCCSECKEAKVLQARSLKEKQEEIVNMRKTEDLKSLTSTTLVFYHAIMKKTTIHPQPLTWIRATQKKFPFNFVQEGSFSGVAGLI